MGAGQKTVYWLLSLHPCLSCKCYWDNTLDIDISDKQKWNSTNTKKMEFHKILKKEMELINLSKNDIP